MAAPYSGQNRFVRERLFHSCSPHYSLVFPNLPTFPHIDVYARLGATLVKMFFVLSNAMMVAGIAAEDSKRLYDSVRPATAIPVREVRTSGEPASMANSISAVMQSVDSGF
jgi:hypothetical protein